MGIRQYFFREKMEKNDILLTFLVHNVYFWQNWRFFDQMWALTQEVFNEKFDNNYIRAICFCENIVVFALNTPPPPQNFGS